MAKVKNASLARVPGATLELDDEEEEEADFSKDALETEPEEDMACIEVELMQEWRGRRMPS